jgi:predicted metal-dependent phosphoesterase TrpH
MSEHMAPGGTGRADLHIHSLASDGVSSVEEILDAAEAAGLDIIAITDHERIDAAVAAQRMAAARDMRVKVIVGEEISTRGGHLVALFLRERIPPWRSLRWSVAKVHEQGGLAIVAHPLVPYPLCASAGTIRRLLDEADSIYHPDGAEALNPTTAASRWGRRAPDFVTDVGLAGLGSSDAHRAIDVGRAVTLYSGSSPDDLRRAIVERRTAWEGTAYPFRAQLETFRHQLRKNAQAVHDEVRGKVRRDGTGRDLGYPGGRRRPARLDESRLVRRSG